MSASITYRHPDAWNDPVGNLELRRPIKASMQDQNS